MPKAKVGDINIYYEIHGGGEPLVFVMGMASTTDSWGPQVQLFSRDYKLIVYDNRGAGRTDAPDIPYSTEMFADDLAGLLDALEIDKAHIRGASAGGITAQQFALRYPERVISLILQGTTCGGKHAPLSDEALTPYLDESLPQEERVEMLIRLTATDEFAARNPALIQQNRERLMGNDLHSRGIIRKAQAFASGDTYDRLGEIQAPTLVLHGDADRVTPVENAHILASRIPNAELVIMPNTGHTFLEAAEERNRVILDFLRRHSLSK